MDTPTESDASGPPVPDPADPSSHDLSERMHAHLAARYDQLERARATAPLVAIGKRFLEIDGFSQGGLLAIELFTVVIPLMIIGFSYLRGFAAEASVGAVFVNELGLTHPLDTTVRSAFGSADGIASTWTIVGMAGFLIWGIPMAFTVARMFSLAWRRTRGGIAESLLRGTSWFVLYLAMLIVRENISLAVPPGSRRLVFAAVALIPAWLFWAISPLVLLRNGRRGFRSLMISGCAGVVIDGVVLPIAARIALPSLLEGWTGFGPMGVAMTLMTWCGVVGFGWVVTACSSAVLWERYAASDIVVDTQTAVPTEPGTRAPKTPTSNFSTGNP